MGGPFRAIVGGATQNMSFPPAQAIQLDNYSDQYGHLRLSDVFVAPGQIGMVVLVDGIRTEHFAFEAPPNSVVSAPTAGQICLIRTYDVAEVGAPTPPLQPGVGVLLPIGVDQPPHHHPHTHGVHLHAHTGTHTHGSATHSHAVAGSHSHTIPNHSHSVTIVAQAGANPVNYDGIGGFLYTGAGGGFSTDSSGGGGATGNTANADTSNTTPAATDPTAPGNTNNATPTSDSTVPDVHHTHP